MSVLTESILSTKDFDVNKAVNSTIQSIESLNLVLKSLKSIDDTLQSNSFQIVLIISHIQPQILYPHWDYFKDLLLSSNTYYQVIGIKIITNLVKIDTEDKFDEIYDLFVGFTHSKKILLVKTVYKAFGKVATFNPEIQNQILQILFDIDNTSHEQTELAKVDVIESLNLLYEHTDKKEKINDFIVNQLRSNNPKTRKTAELFLDKYKT